MASFLCDLVKKYAEKLIDGAIAEARHVICFTCIVKEFEEERAKLEPERLTIEQHVKVAKERDKDIPANVGSWQKDIDELNQVDTKSKQTCFFGFCPDCIWRYKKGKELTNKVKWIKELKAKAETLGIKNIDLSHCLPGVEWSSSENYIPFKSREAKYKELLDALKDDNNYITGLQGMGGTGKTTLAKEVGKELMQSKQFAYVVNTTVSFTPDVKKIQDEIAGSLGLKWEDCNESDRPKKLWRRLTNGDKILVILDDVWDRGPRLDFEAIGIPKRDNHKGCRVLVTSRNRQTFNKMDCDKTIELDLLSKEDGWIMFKRYAGISDSSSKNLIEKGRKIAKECQQLPVAISVIASSLKGQHNREHEWDVTLKSLKQPVSMHGVDEDMVGIYKCLKISYDNLKNENANRLFLLCSVFREDEEISIEVITRLCIGVGLFGEDYGYYNDARSQVVVAKNKLVDSCLLLEVGKKHLKMHDLVREAAQWIAKEEIQCVNLFDKKQKSSVEKLTNIKYLLCEGKCMDLFSFNFDGSKLETLIVKVDKDDDQESIEVPNSFFENVINLRVLYFSGKNLRPLSLPSIGLLRNIRSMSVDNVELGDISILGKLQTLETLELVQCNIEELPDQITELGKFKLLKLEYCKIRVKNPFEVIERCASLEELYFKYSFNGFCQEITLPKLQRYQIRNWWKDVTEQKVSKYVVFNGDDETCQFSKGTLKYCMQTSEGLWLQGIKEGWKNLMPEIVALDLGMNDVVELRLYRISHLRCLIDTTGFHAPKVLSNLVVLELKEMENLVELFSGPLSFESLNNLEKLSIKDCKHLQSLFKGKLSLCNLKSITIESCPMLVFLFEVSTCQSLVLLEKLEIADCEGLKTIIADERREDEEIDDGGNNNKSHGSVFPKLKVIRIRKCDGLKYVFGQSQHVELDSLTELELSELPNFVGIFEECYDPIISSCVKGSSSTSKAEIQLDPIKCNTFSWWNHICCQTRIPLVDGDGDRPHDNSVASESNSYHLNIWERLGIQSKILCNIKKITLTHFPKMKSVFILSIDLIMQLEALTIRNCDELKLIIDTGDHNNGDNNWFNVFPKLKELYVQDCTQLEYIFGHDTIDHQNHMNIQLHLPELKSLHLGGLPSLVAMCPKQYRITFPSLKWLGLGECSQDNTIIKVLSGNLDHFLTLEVLKLFNNSKVENIFSLNQIDGRQQLDLGLQVIELYDLPMMTCLFVGPNNSFALQNLMEIEIVRCDKLKSAFSTSMIRFLPQLVYLRIEECQELEHIIEDDLKNKNYSNSLSSTTCFPKLERLGIIKCNKLKFVFSISMLRFLPQLLHFSIQDCNELEHIIEDDDLENKQNSNSLSSTTCFPKLNVIEVTKCNKLKFVFSTSIVRFLPQLGYLGILECKELEHIIEDDDLENKQNSNSLSSTTYFPKLKTFGVKNCNKLKFVFSTSMLRFLPQLVSIWIEECKELEHIIEDDLKNKQNSNSLSSTTCFPKLEVLGIIKCNKLKSVFPFSICKELPKLYGLFITEANELEEIFKSEDDDQKVDIPNLNIVAFDMLPSLSCAQGNQFQAVKNRFVRNCKKLTLTSALTTNGLKELHNLGINLYQNVKSLFEQLKADTTEDFELPVVENVPDLTNSEEFLIEQSMDQQHSLEETKTIVKPSQLEGSTSEKTAVAIVSTISETKKETSIKVVDNASDLAILPMSSKEILNERSMDQQHSLGETDTIVKPSQLEGSTSEKTAVATVSTISAGTKNEPPIQVAAPKQKGTETEGTSKTNNDQVSLNDDALVNVNSTVEEQFSKGDEIIVSESKSSPRITSPIASQFPSMPSRGDSFQKVEDLSSSLLVKGELEELVSKNHLNYENLSLLTDFLVENPSVRLKDTSLSNRYKGCAYNLLAVLLKFLDIHSFLEVSGPCRSEFVELLQDARSFAFDKDWLDGVERRALFPEIQVSPDALEKLLDSKKQVTKDVENLRLKIDILSQHVEDLKHQLASSEAVLESIIQQEAVLSAPIGY